MPRLEATLASRTTSLPRLPARASASEATTLTRLEMRGQHSRPGSRAVRTTPDQWFPTLVQ